MNRKLDSASTSNIPVDKKISNFYVFEVALEHFFLVLFSNEISIGKKTNSAIKSKEDDTSTSKSMIPRQKV